jgi:hypothetical protein
MHGPIQRCDEILLTATEQVTQRFKELYMRCVGLVYQLLQLIP